MTIGRDDRCPCGSGLRFIQCCLLKVPPINLAPRVPAPAPLPSRIIAQMDDHRAHMRSHLQQFGHVREPLQVPKFSGHRIMIVHNRIYPGKNWNFFSDFLFDYGHTRFGRDWLEDQTQLATQNQHPLFALRQDASAHLQNVPRLPDGGIRPNGAVAARNSIYYDLYVVDDNGLLSDQLLARLKHRDQFQGAAHELFVIATCLRAGFTIIPENENDPNRRHTEFVAVHKSSGQHILVEAKSRHRGGVMGRPGAESINPDFRFRRLIHDAVAKDPENPLALFLDTNISPERANRFLRSPVHDSAAAIAGDDFCA